MKRSRHERSSYQLPSVASFAAKIYFSVIFSFALGLLPAEVAGQSPEKEVDRDLVQNTVESLATIVQREYFDADVSTRVSKSLRHRLAEGRYDAAPTLESLARLLSVDLFELTQDKHLNVSLVQAEQSLDLSDERAKRSRDARGRQENFGVQRVEILPGNVGYLNLTAYYRPEEARNALSAAMRILQHVDAIILDMRSNTGGSPETFALLASYFFDAPRLPLFSILSRSGENRQYATEHIPLAERNESRPVYVLTSSTTFSAGEGTAFILQERKRAEVIGETTAGAANPGRPYTINSRFEVTVPNGKVEVALTGKNWEGRGVKPDVLVPAGDALLTAHTRALRQLLEKAPKSGREAIERQLRVLEAKKH